MPHPDISGEIERVRAYVSCAEQQVNALRIYPRTLPRYPFDTIALEFVSKAFALSKACLILLSSSLPDEAFGLSRSLVECAVNLRYLTREPSELNRRTDEFITYLKADKAYWMYYALQDASSAEKESKIREHGKELGVDPDPKLVRGHWSGSRSFVWETATQDHPLDSPGTSDWFRKSMYAINYHHTSSFVHCSQPALDNYYPNEGMPFCVSVSSGNVYRRGPSTLFVLLCSLHEVIAYALFGMNADRPEPLKNLFSETLELLKPIQPNQS